MEQKKKFLNGEGDAWFNRCHKNSLVRDYKNKDPVVAALKKIDHSNYNIINNGRLLEIGCAGGKRLQYIKNNFDIEVFGVDPSQKAVKQACEYVVFSILVQHLLGLQQFSLITSKSVNH